MAWVYQGYHGALKLVAAFFVISGIMKTNPRFWIILVVALLIGALIGWIDTRPNWDDTGVTIGLILIAGGACGFFEPKLAWLWAIAVGFWIPLLNILSTGNYGSAVAVLFALVGAYIGAAVNWLLLGRS